MGLSPDNPEVQTMFDSFFRWYAIFSASYFIALILIFITLTFYARKTKNPKLHQRLYLARKLLAYIAILGWVVFTGIITGLIHTGL